MAIVSVEKLWTGRGATDTHLNHRTYREMYEVISDDPLEDPVIVANAVGLPQVGSTLGIDPGAVMVDFDLAQSDDSPRIWYVTAKWDSAPELPQALDPEGGTTIDPGGLDDNPLLRPAVWSVSFQKVTEPAVEWYTVNGAGVVAGALAAVRNSAKLPFDPPATVEVSRPVIHVVKNVAQAGATLAFFNTLQDAVNSVAWRGLAARVARIDGVTAVGKIENNVKFVEVALDIAIKWDTWDLRILDCGFAELTSRTDHTTMLPVDVWTKIRDPFNQEATEPVPLDGLGRKLAPGAAPVYLRGVPKQYRLANFNALLGGI